MFRQIAFASALLTSTAAMADEITLEREIQAGTLHEATLDMVVYYLDRDDHFEVVATYATHAMPEDPSRIRMALAEGDEVTFGLPGQRGQVYTFSRSGDAVNVRSQAVSSRVARLED